MNPSPPPLPHTLSHGPYIVNRVTNQVVEPLSSDLVSFVKVMQHNWQQQVGNTVPTTTTTGDITNDSSALLSLRRVSLPQSDMHQPPTSMPPLSTHHHVPLSHFHNNNHHHAVPLKSSARRRSSPITTSSSVSGDGGDEEDRRVRARQVEELLMSEDKRKGTWTTQEDELLRQLVMQHNPNNSNKIRWSLVAHHVPGRVGKQCRERWLNHLAPSVKKTSWSAEEDQLLLESHRTYGNQWSKISKLLEGRPENSVKNRFYSLTTRVQPADSSNGNGTGRMVCLDGSVTSIPDLSFNSHESENNWMTTLHFSNHHRGTNGLITQHGNQSVRKRNDETDNDDDNDDNEEEKRWR